MFLLRYTDIAIEEIDALWDASPLDAAVISVALEELEADQNFLCRMFMHEHHQIHPEPSIASMRIAHLWKQGYNILRLKIWDFQDKGGRLLSERIIVAYDGSQTYYVLACLPRDHAYAPGHPDTIRIMRDYEELKLPR